MVITVTRTTREERGIWVVIMVIAATVIGAAEKGITITTIVVIPIHSAREERALPRMAGESENWTERIVGAILVS